MRSKVKPLLFISPALLYLGIWIYYPIVRNLYLSFLDAPTPRSRNYFFVGLQNYIRLFQDEIFFKSLWHNVIWVLLSITIPVVLGLLLAVLLSGRSRTRLFYAGVYFIPQTIAAVIAAIVWRWIYDPNFGPLNRALEGLGLSVLAQQWEANGSLVRTSVNRSGSWTYVGFCVLIFMAGQQNINPNLYDAAMIDGANAVQRFFYITLPPLRNTILFIVVYTVIGSMKFFDLIYVATNGGPNDASQVLGLYIYNLFLRQGRVNYAATMSTVLTVIILLFSIFLIRSIIRDQEA